MPSVKSVIKNRPFINEVGREKFGASKKIKKRKTPKNPGTINT